MGSLLVLVEYLHKNEGVENKGFEATHFFLDIPSGKVVIKNIFPCEIENEYNDKLIDRLSYYHFPHGYRD